MIRIDSAWGWILEGWSAENKAPDTVFYPSLRATRTSDLTLNGTMFFRLAADAVLLLHLTFIAFAVLGAVLTIRWRWMPIVHLPAAAWGIAVELTGRICPLTYLENSLRQQAGQAGYHESFIEHYLLNIIYPSGLTQEIQYLLAGIVLTTNVAIYTGLVLVRYRAKRTEG